jgi:t-SNARE complex subunit (syntaxin)
MNNAGDNNRSISELTERCERLRTEMAAAERAAEDELADISSGHRRELQRLDGQVKADIARLEKEIEAAREEASAEQIKTSKFEKLIQQYSSSSASSASSSSVRSASTASTATRSTRPPFSTRPTPQRSASNSRGSLSSSAPKK